MISVFCQGCALAPLALEKFIWHREIPIDGRLGASVFYRGRIVHLSISNGAIQFVTAVSETAVFVAKRSLGSSNDWFIVSAEQVSTNCMRCLIRCLH